MLSDYLFEALIIISAFVRERKSLYRSLQLSGLCLQVSLAGAATSIISVATKVLSRDKHVFVATNICLSRQYTSFAATKICLSRQTLFCRDNYVCVATKVLSRQAYFCRDKRRVCRDKTFAATKIILVAARANDIYKQG